MGQLKHESSQPQIVTRNAREDNKQTISFFTHAAVKKALRIQKTYRYRIQKTEDTGTSPLEARPRGEVLNCPLL